ncbi:MAG TPA: type II toxin-antitoxin system VapC family toxin [Bacteroidota bacterium]|nr:type II toxin-antitoxin system VapC family toxin [Bacteroidota bacterium]
MSTRKIVIDTGIILEHLVHDDGPSILRSAMNEYFCYTTAFNAIEVFALARSEREIQAMDDAMSAMKVLGLNSKSAKTVGAIFSRQQAAGRNALCLLIAGVCKESKLPIVTMNPKRFSGIKGLQVIPVRELAIGHRTVRSVSHS